MLRLGREFTKDERDNRVDEVIHFVCNHILNNSWNIFHILA
jgi:hypothetical protein